MSLANEAFPANATTNPVTGYFAHTSSGGANTAVYPTDLVGGASTVQANSIFEDPNSATNPTAGSWIVVTDVLRDLEALNTDTACDWEFREHDGTTQYSGSGIIGIGKLVFDAGGAEPFRRHFPIPVRMTSGFSSVRTTASPQTLIIGFRAQLR